MMNRNTQRRLIELLLQLNTIWPQMDWQDKEQQNMVLDILNDVGETCYKYFIRKTAAGYVDILQPLGKLINDTDWRQISSKEQMECIALCQEIIGQITKKLQQEKEIKKAILFLPYKASMWDSLESIWQAAVADDEHCEAYVMPIPYASLNPDGTVKEWHCERNLFPTNVPMLDWREVDLEKWHPDVIFIHNPYDNYNLVTSVDSHYYSETLKKNTDCLVYVPYYATAGGMAEMQSMFPSYMNVDYIVIQAEKFRKFFSASIPNAKFLPFGSPKFDKVIRLCKNPPEPPVEWRKKLKGRKVFFYNTSLTGFLDCIPLFLQKMEYVFSIFRNRDDVCLLWRPHPLMESTLSSMRPEYIPEFERIKERFITENFGIYDTTPDIEKTIALCDAYIGDGGTSVTSLFGMAGKPVFYLNNMLHKLPVADDWRGRVNWIWWFLPKDWLIAYGNQLWHAPKHDFHYHHVCDLSIYGGGNYYGTLFELDSKLYVTPNNAQDIVVVENEKIVKRIPLERKIERLGAFAGATYVYQEKEDYFFLLPLQYPSVVRYDFQQDKVDYVECANDIFVQTVNNEKWRGAVFHWQDWLILGSAVDSRGLAINRHTLEKQNITICHKDFKGSMFALVKEWGEDEYFFFPYVGRIVTRWNVKTGEVREYNFPAGFECRHPTRGEVSDIRPFSNGIFQDEHTILLAPLWGNMFVKLHIDTGIMEEWHTPFEVTPKGRNEYFYAGYTGLFIAEPDMNTKSLRPKSYQFYYIPTRTRYQFDPQTETFTVLENDAFIDETEMRQHVPGFCQMSEADAYGCSEDAFNSLKDFVDGNISGKEFDRECQMEAYAKIAANNDGTAGVKIYEYIRDFGKGGPR